MLTHSGMSIFRGLDIMPNLNHGAMLGKGVDASLSASHKLRTEGVRFFVYEADGVRRRNVLFGGGARLWRDV